jgi:uncharacterized repeat protein (TIGR01451 family)
MPGSFRVPQRARRFAILLALLPAGAWAADPQITSVVDNPDPVTAGDNYTYAVGIDNSAPDASTSTVLTMTVPSGATFVSASPASANCSATSATVVTCNIGTLAGNSTATQTVNFTWKALGPGPAVITGTAAISSSNDTNLTNNSQSESTTVNSGADLSLTKTDTPDPVVGGRNVTYTLTARNNGPNPSSDLELKDFLPGTSTLISASGPDWTCSHAAGVVTCTRPGPLAVNTDTPPVTIVARITATEGNVTNSATISPASGAGAVQDPIPTNNTATATTAVLPGADVQAVSKILSPSSPLGPGDTATFTVNIRNNGPAVATNLVVTDTLPANWTDISASGAGWSCSVSGQTVTCTRASLAVSGTSSPISISAKAPAAAFVGTGLKNVVNTATVAADENDPVANNSASVTFNVLPEGADLRLSKTKSPNPVAQGSRITSTITVTNDGPRRATGGLRVVEQLSGETFEMPQPFSNGTGWTCTASGDTVTPPGSM